VIAIDACPAIVEATLTSMPDAIHVEMQLCLA
jgi:hypothetical protein